MDIQTLKAFFMWCTIINGGMFLVATVFTFLTPDLM